MPTEPDRVKGLFLAAAALPPADRAEYLAAACGDDADLRGRVEALLRAHDREDSFLLSPAASFLAADGGTASLAAGHLGATADADTLPDPPPPDAALGRVVGGRYTLDAVLGGGGMGTVYRATQSEPVRRAVAVKLIKAGMDSKAVLARFDAERQALALMDHPHIARVYDGGTTDDGRPYFVMELVHGVPLTDYCDHRRLPVAARLHLFVQVCQAVQHAHQKGVIHRDLKPGNVLVAEVDGRPVPKVIDFGVAKATDLKLTDLSFADAGAIVGTPAYMSPEQADPTATDIDTRTDVYALGVVLYELLVGSPPLDTRQFKRGAILEVLRMVREVEPPRPSTKLSTADDLPNIAANRSVEPARLARSMRGELDWVVMKAIEKDRTRRYETANGLARDIERYLADEVVEARPPSAGYRLRKLVRRHKGQAVAAGLVVVALVAGIAGTTWGLVRADRANADLGRKNAELAAEREKVQARFELAQKAITTFHTGVSEDVLLKNEQFKELRTRLLTEAAGFYAELEKLLAGQTDPRSRRALAAGYFELGRLTDKIGTRAEAEAAHRKALAIRRELAAAPGADAEARLDVARSLDAVGYLVRRNGDPTQALRAFEEQRDIAAVLDAEAPSDAVRAFQAKTYRTLGMVLAEMWKVDEALDASSKALDIQQQLTDADPADPQRQFDLAQSYARVGYTLHRRRAEALAAYEKALAIQQKLADAHPANIQFQHDLAGNLVNVGHVLRRMGKPAAALDVFGKALTVRQKLADAHPANTIFQMVLADSHNTVGLVLADTGRSADALAAFGRARVLRQKQADADPLAVSDLLWCLDQFVPLHLRTGQPADALEVSRRTLALRQKRADANPASPRYRAEVARTNVTIGRIHAREGRSAEATTAIEGGLGVLRELVAGDPNFAADLGSAFAARGGLAVRAGRHAEAAADLRRAIDLLDKAPPANLDARVELARTLAVLAGLPGVTPAEVGAFGDRAVAALRAAVAAGWSRLADLAESDYDPFRERADFRALAAGAGG